MRTGTNKIVHMYFARPQYLLFKLNKEFKEWKNCTGFRGPLEIFSWFPRKDLMREWISTL